MFYFKRKFPFEHGLISNCYARCQRMQFCIQLYIDIWKTVPYLQANPYRLKIENINSLIFISAIIKWLMLLIFVLFCFFCFCFCFFFFAFYGWFVVYWCSSPKSFCLKWNFKWYNTISMLKAKHMFSKFFMIIPLKNFMAT